jgi:hypothetical protein
MNNPGWEPENASTPAGPYLGSDHAAKDKARIDAEAAIEALFGTDGLPDLDDMNGPTHWPSIPVDDAADEWAALRSWVEQLQARFSHLDHHVIPLCWWRHNGHVEALAALRDHEQASYTDTATPTSGVEWHRAFRDIESRLREWTSTLACGSIHDPRHRPAPAADPAEWNQFVAADIRGRAGINRHDPATSEQSHSDDEPETMA